ncbi:outer membrane protein [Legionella sp. km772]|uniref:outer membrane protein n=1 Tax=Legionella sp. km772 TaxID=2498111 RepID=UPI000F8C9A9C|nr:outer membrane beta-barrel protein [Legionella sp. km772]RUR12059.1 hypothetical protein ELY15_06340 [Legionella sp. km772]
MRKSVMASLLLLSTSGLYAGTLGDSSLNKVNSIYMQINASLDWIRMNDNQDLVLLAPFHNTYTGSQDYKLSGGLGLGLGLERAATDLLFWQLGVAAHFNTSVQAQGMVWQFGLPEFENFSYRYQVQSSRLVAEGKLLGTYQQKFHPYISGELGAGFNRSSTYREISLIESQLPIAPFRNNTHASFSWGVGLGVDVDLRSNLRLGAGYQFSDLGKAQLGLSPAQETGETLSIAHLYDNQLRIQLTALI